MPMLVMPTWTLERNRVGSDASWSACCAPERPSPAIWTRRTRLELTMAISDIANRPLIRMSAKTRRMSVSIWCCASTAQHQYCTQVPGPGLEVGGSAGGLLSDFELQVVQ